jgi:hypothetical protein
MYFSSTTSISSIDTMTSTDFADSSWIQLTDRIHRTAQKDDDRLSIFQGQRVHTIKSRWIEI